MSLENGFDANISDSIQFWFYLIPTLLSVPCSVFLLASLVSTRRRFVALRHHAIIVLLVLDLIIQVFHIPLLLFSSRLDLSDQWIHIVHRGWSFVDIGLTTTQLIVFAWGTMETFLVHHQYFSDDKSRFSRHYLPLMLLIIYCIVWYCIVIFIPVAADPPIVDLTSSLLFSSPVIRRWEFLFHQLLPSCVMLIFGSYLIVDYRHPKQNRPDDEQTIAPIISIFILYAFFCGPLAVMVIFSQLHIFAGFVVNAMPIAYLLSHYFLFLLPFICCTTLPEAVSRIKTDACTTPQ